MNRTIIAVLTSITLAASGPALAGDAAAASLSTVQGSVMLSQNGKMALASSAGLRGADKPMPVRAGDRIIAKDGQARLTYADGCVVTVKPQSMLTIGQASPCASSSGLVTTGSSAAQSNFSELTPFGMVMAVLAIGGFAYGVSQMLDDDDDPVSP